jgi:hypothetical protein
MPTLTKNQKFQLGQMNATFRSVAGWVKNDKDEQEQRITVSVVDIESGALISEATNIEEQGAIDAAIEKARLSGGFPVAYVDEETRLRAKVDEQAQQLAELSGMVKQLLSPPQQPAKTKNEPK